MVGYKLGSFLGKKITTKTGSIVTMVSYAEVTTSKHPRYVCICSVCSEDSELWPYGSIETAKCSLAIGMFSCGCASIVKWKEWQYVIRMKRLCGELGYTFIGWSGAFKGAKTLVAFVNKDERVNPLKIISYVNINKLTGGAKDPNQFPITISENSSKELNLITLYKNLPKGVQLRRSEKNEWYGNTYIDYHCPICADDKFSRETNSDGWFIGASYHRLSKGELPCRCSVGFARSEGYARWEINEGLSSIKGKIICTDTDKIRSGSLVFWECKHRNINTTRVSYIREGVFTCKCDKTTSTLYLVRWTVDDLVFFKYGRTSMFDPYIRFNKQRSSATPKEQISYEVVSLFVGSYSNVVTCEGKIKKIYNNFVDKILFPDGYTETAECTAEFLLDFDRISKNLKTIL